MAGDLTELTEALLDAARKAGADSADALAVDGTLLSIEALGGKIEKAERAEGVDLGLRVLVGNRQACVASSDASIATIRGMAERAVAMAKAAPEDPSVGLADPAQLSQSRNADGLDLADPAPEPDPEALLDLARRAETAALAVDGITKIDSANAEYSNRRFHYAGTNGFSGGYSRTQTSLVAVAIAGEGTGMERDYCGEARIFSDDLPDAEEIGRIAGERTIARLGARKPPTGAFPVLYDERVASSLVGHLLSAVNGTSISRGASWLRDAMGEQVLPSGLSILEDPGIPRHMGSKPFDGEGLATKARAVVENGMLRGWTLDLATARKLGLDSTGNASRGTTAPPSPSNHNIALTQGERSREDLLREMGTGLLITSMIGSSINPTTGDYSRGAAGLWVENGEITYPVNECTVAGNLREMLATLIPANDARLHLTRAVPSCLVEGLTIAGA